MRHHERNRASSPFLSPFLTLLAAGIVLTASGCRTEEPAPPPPPPPPLVGDPPPPRLLGRVPLAVEGLPEWATPEEARPFFDTFSWQTFVALNWPARAARGEPESPADEKVFRYTPGGAQPVVWGTFKADFELFGQGDERPTEWSSTEVPMDPCGSGSAEAKTFLRISKGDSLVETDDQAFSYPLIDQSGHYAVYEVRFNQAYYDFVRGEDDDPAAWLYLRENLDARDSPGVEMPASELPETQGPTYGRDLPPYTQGAIMVQAAWKTLDPERDDPSRFYAVDARVYDPETRQCSPQRVGLVGLHIVHKLTGFAQWIWASFEHVDNVPGDDGGSGRSYSFNNGTATPATTGGYADRPPHRAPRLQPKDQRVPVQVTRLNPIPESTKRVNAAWRSLLEGTVWSYYQLVITQWPSDPDSFRLIEDGGAYPEDAGGAFPVDGAVNTVMETYFQSLDEGGGSCMRCHYRAGRADFSLTLMRGAH